MATSTDTATSTETAAGTDTAAGLGPAFIDAIERRDFDRLESLFAPEIRFRALTPRREPVASTSTAARAVVEGWFGDADRIEEVDRAVDEIVDRVRVRYRLRVREDGHWKLVEQNAFLVVSEGRIADLSLVCSGFRPLAAAGAAPAARLDASGDDCATLTPRIRAAIGALRSGDVLEVVADDPAAEPGLRAWTRLTGHELVEVKSGEDGAAPSYYLRRR